MSNTKEDYSSCTRLIWHRRDLRLHDNELYSNLELLGSHHEDSGCNDEHGTKRCVSLFIFDKKYFERQPSTVKGSGYDTVWCGPHASRALIEAVTVLRRNLNKIGGELIVREGRKMMSIKSGLVMFARKRFCSETFFLICRGSR